MFSVKVEEGTYVACIQFVCSNLCVYTYRRLRTAVRMYVHMHDVAIVIMNVGSI